MESSLLVLFISSRSINKHGHHRQFFFLIGRNRKKSSPLKLPTQMNRNLVGSIYMYGRLCIKFPQSRMKGERHRLNLQLEIVSYQSILFLEIVPYQLILFLEVEAIPSSVFDQLLLTMLFIFPYKRVVLIVKQNVVIKQIEQTNSIYYNFVQDTNGVQFKKINTALAVKAGHNTIDRFSITIFSVVLYNFIFLYD